jgi:hypothetical protein
VRDDLLKATIIRFVAPRRTPIRAATGSTAQDVAGAYLSSRRIHSGPLMFSGLLNTSHVTAEQDGSLSIESSGFRTKWLPTGRDRFAESNSGIPLVAERDANGKVSRIASAALYPVAVFDRAPGLSHVLPYWAAASLGTMLIAVPVKPIAWFRRRRRQVTAALVNGERETGAAPLRRWARIAYWLMMLTLSAWIAFAIAIAIDFAFLFEGPTIIGYVLGSLTLLMLPWSLIVAADGLLAWRDPENGRLSRLGMTLLGLAAVGTSTLLYTVDAVNMTARW